MTPAARTQAAIDLVDAIATAAQGGGAAGDTIVQRYFATRRYAGAKDRRAVRELVFAAIRACGDPPATGRAAMLVLADRDPALAATFDGSPHAPAPITPADPRATAGIAPGWLLDHLGPLATDALVARAPLDIRVNTLRATVEQVRTDLSPTEPIPGLPDALRLPAGTALEQHPLWLAGAIEVQDAGSQAVTLAVGAEPGMAVVDLCAGAGGKTLALAAAMANRGAILAADTDRTRLRRLPPRAERAGVAIAQARLLDPGREAAALADVAGRADAVLVDAPCSGTGTWRRNPEARWRLTPARLSRLAETQAHLLRIGAALVRPGGALVHVVCSLLDAEGRDQIDRFLADHPGWTAEPLALPLGRTHGQGWRIDPASDGSDGFFVARLRGP